MVSETLKKTVQGYKSRDILALVCYRDVASTLLLEIVAIE